MTLTTKKILIKLEDQRLYSASLHEVVDNRASYYAGQDPNTTYEEEYQFAMNNSRATTDWLLNVMDWYKPKSLKLESHDLLPPKQVPILEMDII
jgi:hypothetical protein